MGSVILDNAEIGEMSLVAAGSVITPGKKVGDFELWAGNPGKFVRKISEAEKKLLDEILLLMKNLTAKIMLQKHYLK